MTLENIQAVILTVLKEVQEVSGNSIDGISPEVVPIGGLEGFDSLCSLEATMMVEEKIGRGQLSENSLFVSDDGSRALSVLEVCKRVEGLMAVGGN